MAMSFGNVGEVGIYIPSTDASCCVVAARRSSGVGLAEDADEVRHPLLVSLSGQQCHDHQLDAQEHEKVAPFGLDTDHGDGSTSSKQQRSRVGSAESQVGLEQPDFQLFSARATVITVNCVFDGGWCDVHGCYQPKSNIFYTLTEIWQHTVNVTVTVCKVTCNNLWQY